VSALQSIKFSFCSHSFLSRSEIPVACTFVGSYYSFLLLIDFCGARRSVFPCDFFLTQGAGCPLRFLLRCLLLSPIFVARSRPRCFHSFPLLFLFWICCSSCSDQFLVCKVHARIQVPVVGSCLLPNAHLGVSVRTVKVEIFSVPARGWVLASSFGLRCFVLSLGFQPICSPVSEAKAVPSLILPLELCLLPFPSRCWPISYSGISCTARPSFHQICRQDIVSFLPPRCELWIFGLRSRGLTHLCLGSPRLPGSALAASDFRFQSRLQIPLPSVQRRRFVLACSHVRPCPCAWIFAVTWCPQSQGIQR
jgi:hypothetical protein